MGGSGGRNLDETPTWAVAVVCFVLLSISIIIEHIIHLIGKWLKQKQKRALYESLEKIKSELMLLGFISLLLTVGQGLISRICISEKVASTFHPCRHETDTKYRRFLLHHQTTRWRLLPPLLASDNQIHRRILAAGASDKCSPACNNV
ncbi:MLO-like protein 2, partial [Mucuna pruriens]